MSHPLFDALDNMPEKPPKYLRVDKTYPEWQIGETYEGTIKFVLVQQDVNGSIFEILDFKAEDEKEEEKDLAQEIADEYKPKFKEAASMIVPSPSE